MPERPKSHRQQEDARRKAEAEEVLGRVARDGHSVADSAIGAAARHFAADDAPADDRVDVWGKRIGRALALAAAAALLVHLLTTYVFV